MSTEHDESVASAKNPKLAKAGFWIGLAIFGLVYYSDLDPAKPAVAKMAAVASIMAIWWVTEAIPIAATSLLPIILFPFLGILSGKDTAPVYFNSTIFLFIGGFMIGFAIERWNLHKRIALTIVYYIGKNQEMMLLGFILASSFFSMWISNTATAIMMTPIGLAIILSLEEKYGKVNTRNFSAALMLAIAYGASIGGVGSLIGTTPNLAFARIYSMNFPNGPNIGFGSWLLLGIPFMTIMIIACWLTLSRWVFRFSKDIVIDRAVIKTERDALGPVRYEEYAVGAVFFATIFMWVFREDLNIGIFVIQGWGDLMPFPEYLDDGTVAILGATLLFFIPASKSHGGADGERLLGGWVFGRLPWGIVLLFGGGFALSKGFISSGLSEYIGNHFVSVEIQSVSLIMVEVVAGMMFLTEFTSNTATTEMIMPVLASISRAIEVNPLMLMLPGTMAVSCAFMLPVATPPNAIVFGSGRVSIMDMMKAGFVLNCFSFIGVSLIGYYLLPLVFGFQADAFPDWAK